MWYPENHLSYLMSQQKMSVADDQLQKCVDTWTYKYLHMLLNSFFWFTCRTSGGSSVSSTSCWLTTRRWNQHKLPSDWKQKSSLNLEECVCCRPSCGEGRGHSPLISCTLESRPAEKTHLRQWDLRHHDHHHSSVISHQKPGAVPAAAYAPHEHAKLRGY